MAILVTSDTPNSLLAAIKAAIADGKIVTWECDKDGDFTHSPEQWKNKAWFRPSTVNGKLVLKILAPKDTMMSSLVYAVYHGRFIEMLLNHFDKQFVEAVATALPSNGDIVSPR